MANAILAATVSAVFEYAGQPVFVYPGTTIREGHPMLEGHEDLFGPLIVDYDLPSPVPAAVPPPEPAKKVEPARTAAAVKP